jgi:hypothetical protein
MTGGTRLTATLARQHNRPWLAVDLAASRGAGALERVRTWLEDCRPGILNVAGPRESTSPGIGARAARFLNDLFGPTNG